MGYRLGVDVGTTFTAAAVDDGSGPRMLGLGNRALQVPSVLFLQEDGTFLCGETAERRGGVEPTRVVREFKRRFGDTVPILVSGQPFSPQALTARLLSFVVAVATEREGSAPDEVVLTHPANWGGYKRELMDQVIQLADLPSALTCTEPEAAAIQYASRAVLAPDAKVAVYDLGGGTFDVCVLQKQQTGFRVLGSPEGVEHMGGIDFDEAVFQHVLRSLGDDVGRLDLDDPLVTTALTRLRRECVEAKEALSNDVDTAVAVNLPGLSTTVRLTRTELESLITPALRDTLAATRRALRSADTTADQLAAVVLVGGSSRIPLVSHLLHGEFGVTTAMDTHPKHDIALGAVRYHPPTADETAPLPAPVVAHWPTRGAPTTVEPTGAPDEEPEVQGHLVDPPSHTVAPRAEPSPVPEPSTRDRSHWSDRLAGLNKRGMIVIAATVLGAAAVGGVVLAGQRDSADRGGQVGGSTSPQTTSSATQGGTLDPAAIPVSTMLLHLEEAGGSHLFSYDVVSHELVSLGLEGNAPTISPDRKHYIFLRDAEPYIADWIAPTSAHKLFDAEGPCTTSDRPAWNPNGTELAVACRPRDGDHDELFIVGADGRTIRSFDDTGITGGPTWVDESTIVYAREVPEAGTDLWEINLDDERESVTSGPGFDAHPNWSADRQELLFLRKQSAGINTEGAVIMTIGGSASTSTESTLPVWSWDDEPLPHPLADEYSQLRLANPTWSPDGAEIAFLGTDDQDRRHMYVLQTDDDSAIPEEMKSDSGSEIQEPGPLAWDSR